MSPTLVMSIMQGPLCGTLTTMMVYGIICMQTFYYSQNYQSDRVFLKVLVAVIWVLETAHTALAIHFIEHYLILGFGDTTLLQYAVWSMAASYFIGFFIAYAVNLCYIWRIWLLSQKRWIGCVFALLATTRLAFGLTNCSLNFRYLAWKNFRLHVFPTMVTGWALSAVVDSAIAVTLCYYLHKHRTGMRRTDSIINQLLLYSINTGAITSCFAVLVIIMFLGLPNTLAFIGFVQVQSKLYAVSLLATLNTRKTMMAKARLAVPTGENIPLSTTTPVSPPPSSSRLAFSKHHRPITIQRSMVVISDEGHSLNDKPMGTHIELARSDAHADLNPADRLGHTGTVYGDDEAPFG